MTERRTDPIEARFVSHDEFLDAEMLAVPGTIAIDPEDETRWLYGCPCGCGMHGALRVARQKPQRSPSWSWDGSWDYPTLTPSVHHVGHWHGWLRAGVWVSV